MISEIKKIEKEEILSELKEMERLLKIKEKLEENISKKEHEQKEMLSRKQPNIFSRIFRTKRYKNYLLGEKTLSTLQEEIDELKKELISNENALKEYYKREKEYKQRIKDVERVQCLEDLKILGYSFKEAVEKLKEAGIPIILTEDEKEHNLEKIQRAEDEERFLNDMENDLINMNPFASLSDIIMVHKTDYAPKGDRIESRASGNVLEECNIILGGEEYTFSCKSGRDTVHLAANHEVSANNGGNWDNMKYAIIIPFEDLKEHSQIQSAQSVDTYTRGPVILTENSYILCPIGEGKNIQEDNPNVTVFEYEGENVTGFANMLISELGYKLEIGNDYGFKNAEQARRYYKIMEENGFIIKRHAHSEDKKREKEIGIAYQYAAVMKIIIEQKIADKIGREELLKDLEKHGILNRMSYMIFEEESGKVLLEELNKSGIRISKSSYTEELEKHTNEEKILDQDPKVILMNHMLDNVQTKEIEEI